MALRSVVPNQGGGSGVYATVDIEANTTYVDFTEGFDEGDVHEIHFGNVKVDEAFNLGFQIDCGSGWETGAYPAQLLRVTTDASDAVESPVGETRMGTADVIGGAAGEGCTGWVRIVNPQDNTSGFKMVEGAVGFIKTDGTRAFYHGYFWMPASGPIQDIRFKDDQEFQLFQSGKFVHMRF